MVNVLTREPDVQELNRKLDYLTEQVAFLADEARRQQERREDWADLKRDASPILNDLYRLAVELMAEMEDEVQLEDILRLFKRLVRSTRRLEQSLDQLDSLLELWQEVGPIGQAAFLSLTRALTELEAKGYFVFLQGGLNIIERIVTSFSEEDVHQLGDNIVLILQTVKEMTQPEIMNFVHTTVSAAADEVAVDTSLLSIIRQLNDPAVRRGLARTLNVLKAVSDQ
jgi:uncharacterized protein YjgD (DUF1641 family)